jgi:hypothetical protein
LPVVCITFLLFSATFEDAYAWLEDIHETRQAHPFITPIPEIRPVPVKPVAIGSLQLPATSRSAASPDSDAPVPYGPDSSSSCPEPRAEPKPARNPLAQQILINKATTCKRKWFKPTHITPDRYEQLTKNYNRCYNKRVKDPTDANLRYLHNAIHALLAAGSMC